MLGRSVGEEESNEPLEATPMVRRMARRRHEEALRWLCIFKPGRQISGVQYHAHTPNCK